MQQHVDYMIMNIGAILMVFILPTNHHNDEITSLLL